MPLMRLHRISVCKRQRSSSQWLSNIVKLSKNFQQTWLRRSLQWKRQTQGRVGGMECFPGLMDYKYTECRKFLKIKLKLKLISQSWFNFCVEFIFHRNESMGIEKNRVMQRPQHSLVLWVTGRAQGISSTAETSCSGQPSSFMPRCRKILSSQYT